MDAEVEDELTKRVLLDPLGNSVLITVAFGGGQKLFKNHCASAGASHVMTKRAPCYDFPEPKFAWQGPHML